MKPIKAGAKAPAFTMYDVNEQPVQLSDFPGKKVLLSWHPIAWTSVCTDQMRALDVNWEKFQALNTVPLGISVDPVPSKKVWAVALALKHLPLLADFWPHGKVAKDYGIFHEEFGMSERANILIDEKGLVQWVKVYPMGELPDLNEVFEVLSKSK
jgi:peroxiredoxin